MSIKQLQTATSELLRAVGIGIVFGLLLMVTYLAFEPVLGQAIEDEFTVTQEITGEIAFSTPANDVDMAPALASVTGGTSTGASQVVVTTNSAGGYTMDIRFATGTNDTAVMEDGSGNVIPNYPATTTPDHDFSAPANSAAFGYAVKASNTTDVVALLRDNGGGVCNSGTDNTDFVCFIAPTTTDRQIINRLSAPPTSGATTTIQFQVVVSPNPSPLIPTGFYTATATLTALTQ